MSFKVKVQTDAGQKRSQKHHFLMRIAKTPFVVDFVADELKVI
jgi:hypothetical protein